MIAALPGSHHGENFRHYRHLTSIHLIVGFTLLLMQPTRRCGHCQSIKPDWDKLIADFEGSPSQMIADVDCTAEGEQLCKEFGIQGYPTLKWGDPSDLQDYNGGRSYEDLKQFADEYMK